MSKLSMSNPPCFYSIIDNYDHYKGMYMELLMYEVEYDIKTVYRYYKGFYLVNR